MILSTEFGDLYMWGWNQSGQLGLPSDTTESDSTTSSGQVQRQMVPLPCPVDFTDNLEVVTVSCGSRHSAAITGKFQWFYHGLHNLGKSLNFRERLEKSLSFKNLWKVLECLHKTLKSL